MPTMERIKTGYPGVYYVIGDRSGGKGKEKIFYIMYRKEAKLIEEKAGRQNKDAMTPAKAAGMRAARIEGRAPTNNARREAKKAEKTAWTVSRLWNEYKAVCSPKSIVSDDNRFENYIKKDYGDKELKDIDPLSIDRLKAKLLKIRKPQTVAHVIEIIRRISNFAVRKRLCPGLNFKIALPKFNNEKTENLTPEQLSNLLEVIEEGGHPQAGKMLLLALYLGLRRSEIFSLTWNSIDFYNGFVYLKETKGGQNEKVPLNDMARDVLEQIPKTESSFVFPSRKGDMWVDIKKHVNLIKKRAGLPSDFRIFHGLRHVFASQLASSGKVDLYYLQKLLRHRSPKMVQRYSHLKDEALKKSSNLIGEIVKETLRENESNVISLKGENRNL